MSDDPKIIPAFLWDELRVGDLVTTEAEDFFQLQGTSPAKAEFPFRVEGRIIEKTQRRIVVRGTWEWLCSDDCTPDDPQITQDEFGVMRRSIEALTVWTKRFEWRG